MKKKKKKSPLTGKPLRNPGQSLDEEIRRLIDDKYNSYALFTSLIIAVAAMEWIRWYQQIPPQPLLWTFIAVGVLAYSSFRIYGLRQRVKRLKQGRDGEKAVGQYLELLRASGCCVFHDIVGDGFNIDHVVLSQRGIYVVETKTYSKPVRGEPVVLYQNETLIIDGYDAGGAAIRQAKAEAATVQKILKSCTGKKYQVKPVVVFPGWFIKPKDASKNSEVWVLNPKALPKFIESQPEILTAEDLRLASMHLSKHIRSLEVLG